MPVTLRTGQVLPLLAAWLLIFSAEHLAANLSWLMKQEKFKLEVK